MTTAFATFVLCASLVVFTGMKISAYGDEIAERYQVGGALVGIVVLALVTSFPELVIGITSSALASPDFAVGNALGSNLYNLTILAVADGFHRTGTLLGSVSRKLLLSCAMSQFLVAGACLALILKPAVTIGWVGLDTSLLLVSYVCCLGMLTRAQAREDEALEAVAQGAPASMASLIAAVPERSIVYAPDEDAAASSIDREVSSMATELAQRPLESLSNRALWGRLCACALLILASGPPMVAAAERVASATGLGQTFVGSVGLSIVGSLPELVVSIAAVRIGAYDMAVGNVLGSNMFNVVLLFVSDLFYLRGGLLYHASPEHLVVGLFVLVLTSVVMIGLLFRSRRTIAGFGLDSVVVIIGYLAAIAVLYGRAMSAH